MNFAAIDVETASNAANSIVSVGVAKRIDGEIVIKEWLVQPPPKTRFVYERHVEIHGITRDMVANEPFFPEVWEKVKAFLGDENITLVAHNAPSAEARYLNGVFEHYNMGKFNLPLLCSLKLASLQLPRARYCGQKHSLEYLMNQFGLTMLNHHHAGDDAAMALMLFERLCDDEFIGNLRQKLQLNTGMPLALTEDELLPLEDKLCLSMVGAKRPKACKPRKITSNLLFDEEQKNHVNEFVASIVAESSVLVGQTIVTTGTLEHFTRDAIEAIIKRLGGKPSSSVSGKTSFLIVGDKPGSKLTKAQALGIPVLTEAEFIKQYMGR